MKVVELSEAETEAFRIVLDAIADMLVIEIRGEDDEV